MNTGWYEDPAAVEASTILMGGDKVLWRSSPFRGYAQRTKSRGNTGSFLWEAQDRYYPDRVPFYQARGTCVGQAGACAGEDSLWNGILYKGLVSRHVEISVAASYAVGRVKIGKNRIRGDGLVGAWLAEGISKFGMAERKKYGRYNLSRHNKDEHYATEWGSDPKGCPSIVLKEMSEVQLSCHRLMEGEDVLDALYAKCGVIFCGRHTVSDKDKFGYSRLNQPANHCTALRGACVDVKGNDRVGVQQSWGENRPSGTDTLTYKDGEVKMRDAIGFVPIEDIDRELRGTGEAWAFEFKDGKAFR